MEWKEITSYYSEIRRHYNGKYLEKSYLLDDVVEIQIYSAYDEELDYTNEIFVTCKEFYGSTYPSEKPYEVYEQMKKDLYEGRLNGPYTKDFINKFVKKYDLCIAFDSYFSGFEKLFME